jgi:hypothetical protein
MTNPLLELRVFKMIRHDDVPGVSGIGVVAVGVIFPTGKVVIQWLPEHRSIEVWDSLEGAIFVHGHDGKTEFVFEGDDIMRPISEADFDSIYDDAYFEAMELQEKLP